MSARDKQLGVLFLLPVLITEPVIGTVPIAARRPLFQPVLCASMAEKLNTQALATTGLHYPANPVDRARTYRQYLSEADVERSHATLSEWADRFDRILEHELISGYEVRQIAWLHRNANNRNALQSVFPIGIVDAVMGALQSPVHLILTLGDLATVMARRQHALWAELHSIVLSFKGDIPMVGQAPTRLIIEEILRIDAARLSRPVPAVSTVDKRIQALLRELEEETKPPRSPSIRELQQIAYLRERYREAPLLNDLIPPAQREELNKQLEAAFQRPDLIVLTYSDLEPILRPVLGENTELVIELMKISLPCEGPSSVRALIMEALVGKSWRVKRRARSITEEDLTPAERLAIWVQQYPETMLGEPRSSLRRIMEHLKMYPDIKPEIESLSAHLGLSQREVKAAIDAAVRTLSPPTYQDMVMAALQDAGLEYAKAATLAGSLAKMSRAQLESAASAFFPGDEGRAEIVQLVQRIILPPAQWEELVRKIKIHENDLRNRKLTLQQIYSLLYHRLISVERLRKQIVEKKKSTQDAIDFLIEQFDALASPIQPSESPAPASGEAAAAGAGRAAVPRADRVEVARPAPLTNQQIMNQLDEDLRLTQRPGPRALTALARQASVLFQDFDGTIVDYKEWRRRVSRKTLRLTTNAIVKETSSKFPVMPPSEDVLDVYSSPTTFFWPELLDAMGLTHITEHESRLLRYQRWYAGFERKVERAEPLVFVDDWPGFAGWAAAQSIPIVVITGNSGAEALLEKGGERGRVGPVHLTQEGAPQIDGYLKQDLKRLEIPAQKRSPQLVFSDSPDDLREAKTLGLTTVAVVGPLLRSNEPWAWRKLNELLLHADYVIVDYRGTLYEVNRDKVRRTSGVLPSTPVIPQGRPAPQLTPQGRRALEGGS